MSDEKSKWDPFNASETETPTGQEADAVEASEDDAEDGFEALLAAIADEKDGETEVSHMHVDEYKAGRRA